MLLLSLLGCWSSPAESTPYAEILYVPAGWTAPEAGYWMAPQAARDIAAGWGSDRAERDYLRGALEDQFDRSEASIRSMGWSIGHLGELDEGKNEAHAAELRKRDKRIAALERGKWIPGVIIGAGLTERGELRGVVGVGWKL